MARRSGRLTAVCLALVLLVAACGNSSDDEASGGGSSGTGSPSGTAGGGGDPGERDTFVEITGVPGVSDDEIAYAVVGTKTGNPLGICILDCYVEGIEAYFAYRNSEGGIYGRDLVIDEVVDDELVANQQRTLDVISSGDAFGVFQATLLANGWGDLDQAGVPTYGWGIHATEAADRAAIFPSTVVRCPDCTHTVVPYVASQEGATRAAALGYGVSENSKVCAGMLERSFERWQDESGVEVVYANDDLDYGMPNGVGPEVTAMKEAGVDFIATCVDSNGMKTLAQELDRQGMGDVTLYHQNSYDQGIVAESDPLFEGDIVTVQFRPFEVDEADSAMADFREWMAEQGSEESELAMVGWINASFAFDGLLAAGPDFDQQQVIDATNELVDYTAGGLVHHVTWGQAHTPYTEADPLPDRNDCATVVKVEGGEFVPFGDPATPWMCWEQWDTETFEPTPTDFG